MSDQSEDISAVEEYFLMLEDHRRNCEQQGKYVEAEIAENRLAELRIHEYNRQREAMQARQMSERLGVEEAHMLEYKQFNMTWDRKMDDYESRAEDMVESMKERHISELREYQATLLGRHQTPKFSPELLNYRKIEEHLAKSRNYNEAHRIKAKADALEEREMEIWTKKKQREMYKAESTFKNAKRQELSALLKRIMAGREEKKQQRHVELERLLQRYQNVKNELGAQQNLERINRERMSAGGCSGRASISGSVSPPGSDRKKNSAWKI